MWGLVILSHRDVFLFYQTNQSTGRKLIPECPTLMEQPRRWWETFFVFVLSLGQKYWKIKSQAFSDKDHFESEPGCQEDKLTESGSSELELTLRSWKMYLLKFRLLQVWTVFNCTSTWKGNSVHQKINILSSFQLIYKCTPMNMSHLYWGQLCKVFWSKRIGLVAWNCVKITLKMIIGQVLPPKIIFVPSKWDTCN